MKVSHPHVGTQQASSLFPHFIPQSPSPIHINFLCIRFHHWKHNYTLSTNIKQWQWTKRSLILLKARHRTHIQWYVIWWPLDILQFLKNKIKNLMNFSSKTTPTNPTKWMYRQYWKKTCMYIFISRLRATVLCDFPSSWFPIYIPVFSISHQPRGGQTPLGVVTTCDNGVFNEGIFMHLSRIFPSLFVDIKLLSRIF